VDHGRNFLATCATAETGGSPSLAHGESFTVVGVLPSTFYFLWADAAIFMATPIDANSGAVDGDGAG